MLISYSCSSNNCLLYSVASQVPGTVTVTVKSIRGNFLGETSFDYVDEVENVLQMLLRNRRLQARYFLLLAQELGNRSLSDPTDHVKEDKHPSEHFSSEKPGITLESGVFCFDSDDSSLQLLPLITILPCSLFCVCVFVHGTGCYRPLIAAENRATFPFSLLANHDSASFFHATFMIQSMRCLLQS